MFECLDRTTGEKVAVKVLSLLSSDPGVQRRVAREIEILSGLSHPNVVRARGSGRLPSGHVVLAMEWLKGDDLATHVARERMSLRDVLLIGRQVASALAAAHRLGIIHRDIKPANVFLLDVPLGRPPEVKVLDFGVAKAGDVGTLTNVGAILGTPAYMAPEQASAAKTVDGRADIFSLGVVLYELIAGRLPWNSPTDLARLARIFTEKPIPLRELAARVPISVADLIASMLAADPNQRPKDMLVVLERLAALLTKLPAAVLDQSKGSEEPEFEAVTQEFTAEASSEMSGAPPLAQVLSREEPSGDGMVMEASLISFAEELPQGSAADLQATVRVEPSARTEGGAPVLLPTAAESVDASGPTHAADRGGRTVARPMLGRKSLLDRLLGEVQSTLIDRTTRTIAVLGPAGAGKTRLWAELSVVLRRVSPSALLLAGIAEEADRATPFGYVRRVLRSEAQIYPDDSPAVQRSKLEALLPEGRVADLRPPVDPADVSPPDRRGANLLPRFDRWGDRPSMASVLEGSFTLEGPQPLETPEEERLSVLAAVGQALKVDFGSSAHQAVAQREPRVMSTEVKRGFDILLRTVARVRGLILLVDEAQLLDRQSAALLGELVRPERKEAVALVAFGLPTLLDETKRGRTGWAAGASVVELPALDPASVRALAKILSSGRLPADALESVIQQSGGNPLFLEQLIFAEGETRQQLPGDPGRAQSAAGTPAALPATVAVAVRRRLAALPAEEQETLGAAAMFGEQFWAEGVSRILSRPLDVVLRVLDRLQGLGFVRPRPRSRYQKKTELELTHGVIRRVVMSRLARGQRRRLELGVLEFLKDVGERNAAILASRQAQCGLLAEAARLYEEAARQSVAEGDFVAASGLAEEGLRLVEGGEVPEETQIELLDAAAKSFELAGYLEEAEHALELLSLLLAVAGDDARIGVRRAALALAMGRFEEGRRVAKESADRLDALSDPSAAAWARVVEAETAEALEDDRRAIELYIRCQAQLAGRQDPRLLGRVAVGLGRIALASADYGTADQRFSAAFGEARALSDLDTAMAALLGLAVVARRTGESARSLRCFDAAERLALDQKGGLRVLAQRALLTAELGDLARASQDLDQLAKEAKANKDDDGWILALLLRSQLWVGFGEPVTLPPEEARHRAQDLARAIELARRVVPSRVLALDVAHAHALVACGDAVRAWTVGGAALSRFETLGAVRDDEAPRLYLSHAATLLAARAPSEHVREAKKKAIVHLDLALSHLERPARERYLGRALALRVQEEAARAGLTVVREPKSHRLSLVDR